MLSRDSSWGLSRVSIGVPHGVSIRVPHGVSIRVPHGVSRSFPHGVSIRVPHGVVIHPDICPDTEGDHRLAFLQHLQHPAATVCHIEPDTLVLTDLGHLNKYIKKNLIGYQVTWESMGNSSQPSSSEIITVFPEELSIIFVDLVCISPMCFLMGPMMVPMTFMVRPGWIVILSRAPEGQRS